MAEKVSQNVKNFALTLDLLWRRAGRDGYQKLQMAAVRGGAGQKSAVTPESAQRAQVEIRVQGKR